MKIKGKLISTESFDDRNGWGLGDYGTIKTYESGLVVKEWKTQHRHTGISSFMEYKFRGLRFLFNDYSNSTSNTQISILQNKEGYKVFTFGNVDKIVIELNSVQKKYLSKESQTELIENCNTYKQIELLN